MQQEWRISGACGRGSAMMPPATAAMHSQGDLLSLGSLLKRAHSLMSNVVEPALIELGFTYVQYVVLLRLRTGIAVNPTDISTQLRYNGAAVTRVVDQLEDRGLLKRVRRDRDRRKVDLDLCPAACDTIDGIIELVVDRLNRALTNFSDSEVQELQRLLVKLTITLQSTVEPGATDTLPTPTPFDAGPPILSEPYSGRRSA
jgi:MarR family multiple antibiotic resistance transcriptional regulator